MYDSDRSRNVLRTWLQHKYIYWFKKHYWLCDKKGSFLWNWIYHHSYPTSTVGVANFCPLIGFPLYLRTEAGCEISSGTLTAGYQSSTIIISAIGTQQSQVRPVLFQDKTALLQALDGSNIYAAISPNNPLAINSTNKITSVNSCLIFIVAIKPGAQVGDLYPQNLLNFSFTETELTS